jgi:hypothetical protein
VDGALANGHSVAEGGHCLGVPPRIAHNCTAWGDEQARLSGGGTAPIGLLLLLLLLLIGDGGLRPTRHRHRRGGHCCTGLPLQASKWRRRQLPLLLLLLLLRVRLFVCLPLRLSCCRLASSQRLAAIRSDLLHSVLLVLVLLVPFLFLPFFDPLLLFALLIHTAANQAALRLPAFPTTRGRQLS